MGKLLSFSCTNEIPQDDVLDGVEAERPSGLAVTTLVAQFLSNGGYSCTEPEPDLEHHAWFLNATKDNASIYVQVNDIDETELIVMAQETKGCLWFSGGSENARTLLEYLMAEMKKDDHFGEFKWER